MTQQTIERRFIQALPSDNPWLPAEYVDVLRETFSHRPELLEAYLHGSWDALEGADQIIKALWLRQAAQKKLIGWARKPRLIVDPARFGDDECVIMYMEITDILEYEIMAQCSAPVLVGRLAELSHQHNDCPVVVEMTGGDLFAILEVLGHESLVSLDHPGVDELPVQWLKDLRRKDLTVHVPHRLVDLVRIADDVNETRIRKHVEQHWHPPGVGWCLEC